MAENDKIETQDELLEKLVVKRIEQLLEERKITKYRLAQKTGITQAALSLIFSGKSTPSLYIICRICLALNIPYDEFFNFSSPRLESLSFKERNLLAMWNSFNENEKKMIMDFALSLKNGNNPINNLP